MVVAGFVNLPPLLCPPQNVRLCKVWSESCLRLFNQVVFCELLQVELGWIVTVETTAENGSRFYCC